MTSLKRPPRRLAVATLLFLTILTWHVETIAGQLTASWVANTSAALGISVERATGSSGAFTEIVTTGPTATTYTDPTVTDGTTYCYRVRAYNPTAYSDYSNTACGATAQAFGLAVVMTGTGSGVVISAPSGILCGTTCSGTYGSGTAVTLTATPATGSTFAGWNGGGCAGTGTCTVTVTSTRTVTATFNAQGVSLAVNKAGTGTGTVSSTPAGITCGTTCSATYPYGTAVTLTAVTATSSTFTGWSGACTGTGSCSAALTSAATVTATFTQPTQTQSQTLTVGVSGTGTVTSSPAGINCGTTCLATYPSGTAVALTATPGAGFAFRGWSGACTGTGSCAVSMTTAQTVTATFASTTSTDTTRPHATIASPKNNSFVKGSTSVSVSASDNIAIAKVQLYVDKVLYTEAKTAPYTFTWDTTQTAQGPHILTAIAYDTAGNSKTSNPVAVTVDNTPPAISPVSVAKVGTHLNVTMSVTDNIKVAKVVLYVDGKLIATDTSNAYSFSIDLKHFALGPHVLEVRAYDPAGNVGSSGQMTFTR